MAIELVTWTLNYTMQFEFEARSFEISLQHNCIKLKCYITLEKDKDAKKKRNDSQSQMTPPATPTNVSNNQDSSMLDNLMSPISPYQTKCQSKNPSLHSTPVNSTGGGAKKVNVEVIMKSNPFRVG